MVGQSPGAESWPTLSLWLNCQRIAKNGGGMRSGHGGMQSDRLNCIPRWFFLIRPGIFHSALVNPVSLLIFSFRFGFDRNFFQSFKLWKRLNYAAVCYDSPCFLAFRSRKLQFTTICFILYWVLMVRTGFSCNRSKPFFNFSKVPNFGKDVLKLLTPPDLPQRVDGYLDRIIF